MQCSIVSNYPVYIKALIKLNKIQVHIVARLVATKPHAQLYSICSGLLPTVVDKEVFIHPDYILKPEAC